MKQIRLPWALLFVGGIFTATIYAKDVILLNVFYDPARKLYKDAYSVDLSPNPTSEYRTYHLDHNSFLDVSVG
ncbi:hypothetical protein CH373_03900 [Leptospira perolatii]|uniref:Uncharacterized protein n=1 Tax=Leptospira perolatii TaxID=2023191 RepID=A0A2M9ZQ37_9LEPT|nr:hypothetical protein [Leptospira perolatii]PJZ69050.1 hypothetical protein CH360_13430 [Leptospira perolatii]PJZ74081.1 hypothetical protein CH373_03900 [Leptospira perolatii]